MAASFGWRVFSRFRSEVDEEDDGGETLHPYIDCPPLNITRTLDLRDCPGLHLSGSIYPYHTSYAGLALLSARSVGVGADGLHVGYVWDKPPAVLGKLSSVYIEDERGAAFYVFETDAFDWDRDIGGYFARLGLDVAQRSAHRCLYDVLCARCAG